MAQFNLAQEEKLFGELLDQEFGGLPLSESYAFVALWNTLAQYLAQPEFSKKKPRVAILNKGHTSNTVIQALESYIECIQITSHHNSDPLSFLEHNLNGKPVDMIVFPQCYIPAKQLPRFFQTAYFNLRRNGKLLCEFPTLCQDAFSIPKEERGFLDAAADGGFSLHHPVRSDLVDRIEMQLKPFDAEVHELDPSWWSSEEKFSATAKVYLCTKVQRRGPMLPYLPSFRPKALIYNNYFETSGGGERSSLDLARALDELGFEVVLACAQKAKVSVEELKRTFGISSDYSWPLLEFNSEYEIERFLVQERYSVFVNHTTCSFMPNTAPLGMYFAMFPFDKTPMGIEKLSTYQVISCNSHFTERYVARRWGRDLPTKVVPPPISEVHLDKDPVLFEEKQKIILNVGRFNIRGHHKCQLEAIESFVKFVDQGIFDDSWRLVVAGHVNHSAENEAYVEQCKKTAQGTMVEVRTNIELDELCSLYRQASLLWQFTGINLDFGVEPGLCEHLGLVALDCFAYGVVPMVFHRGGMNYLIEHGVNGYSFGDTEELGKLCAVFAKGFGSGEQHRLFENTLRSVEDFTFAVFRDRIEDMVRKTKLL